MLTIRTVTRDIPAETLGICYLHEHLLGQPPPPYADQDADLVLDSVDAAIKSVNELLGAGGRSLVEMTPIDYHRQPAALADIARKTGANIIAATGYLKDKFSQPLVEAQSVEHIAARLSHEIEHGMDDTEIRAGVLKASSSLNIITTSERKVFLAAAQAQQQTGALISTHTEGGTMALEQIELLTAHGVPPHRILIGHLDRHLDLGYHRRIADTGVYMGFDQIGKTKYAAEADRITMIEHLLHHGHLQQIMLSMDIARKSSIPAYGGQPGFPYLLDQFIPLLLKAGIPAESVRVMLKENPARALALQQELK